MGAVLSSPVKASKPEAGIQLHAGPGRGRSDGAAWSGSRSRNDFGRELAPASRIPGRSGGPTWDFGGLSGRTPDPGNGRDGFSAPSGRSVRIAPADDPLEREADRVADQVMRISAAYPTGIAGHPPVLAASARHVQRSCSCRGSCADCRRHGAGQAPAGDIESITAAPGRSLDDPTRAFFEPLLGRNLGNIRVHADAQAARSAKSLQARAYTIGAHIVFADGEYAPASASGRRLLGHELAHTMQQGGSAGGTVAPIVQRQPAPGGDERLTLPGRECPIGEVKFAGACVPLRPRPPMFDQHLHLDPSLSPPAPGAKGGTSVPAGTAPTGCKYSVTYANPVEIECDRVWRAQRGTPPPGSLCGKSVIFEITSVAVNPAICPLEGLDVSEVVATIPDSHRCTPPGFTWPPPSPCKIGPGGRLTGCTDMLTVCGLTSELHFGGCTENVAQTILVGGNPVEHHVITFDVDVDPTATVCQGATVTRK